MYELKQWQLLKDKKGNVRAYGYVFNNPKFCAGEDITTSHIEKISVDEENGEINILTYSNSNYLLRFEEINAYAVEMIKECMTMLNISNDVVDMCVKCSEKNKEILRKRCLERLKVGEMYLIMAGARALLGYFKNKDEQVNEVEIRVHSGMYQDSVLVRCPGGVDFRYFPKGWSCDEITPYQWSQSIERIIIKNIGVRLKFINRNDSDEFLVCESGEELVVEAMER